jgi:hypothetical protein
LEALTCIPNEKKPVLRIRDVHPGRDPNFFDPGSKRFRIPDPHQRTEVFLTQKIVLSSCFVPAELFSYQERLLQQNGEIRKRDGRENYMCMGAVSYKDMFTPPPLPSPLSKCDKGSSWPACATSFRPPSRPFPPPPLH